MRVSTREAETREELIRAQARGVVVNRGGDDQLVCTRLLDERLEAAQHGLR